MVSARYFALPLLYMIGFSTARPVPEPFSIRGLWDDIKGRAGGVVDKTKNALFPSKPTGSTPLTPSSFTPSRKHVLI